MGRDIKIVIAHYNENLDWVDDLEYPYIIYSKGICTREHIKLNNVGREANTYLEHIVRNYHNLNEFTVFLQGGPFFHTKSLFRKNQKFKKGYCPIKTKKYYCDLNGSPHDPGLNLFLGFNVIERQPRHIIEFWANALFIVDKESIRNNTKEYYTKLIDYTKNGHKPAHVLERLWQYIFN
jgi:hypothetical protein